MDNRQIRPAIILRFTVVHDRCMLHTQEKSLAVLLSLILSNVGENSQFLLLKALPLLKAFVKKMFAQFIKNLQTDLEVYNISLLLQYYRLS